MKHGRQDYDRIQDPAMLIPKDEPVFLLRAQDMCAAPTVLFWANMAMNLGAKPVIVTLAIQQAERMEKWRKHKIPDLLLYPDFSEGGNTVSAPEDQEPIQREEQEEPRPEPEQLGEAVSPPDRRKARRRQSDLTASAERSDKGLQDQLIGILQNHCGERGDSEGAVETLNRIIRERDAYRQPRPDQGEAPPEPDKPEAKGGA